MATFGETLRAFRQAGNDPNRLNRRLSQQRLGELMGEEMDDLGFSGAAVSDWERDQSKISAADRKVLIALIKVLHRCGGLKTLAEADHFLALGNYRALDVDEVREIFGENFADARLAEPVMEDATHEGNLWFVIKDLFSVSEEELRTIITKAKGGPAPSWPHILAALMRKAVDHFSISARNILWIWVGLIAWWLIGPSLRLPFVNRGEFISALQKYVIGTLVVPLLIGLLVNTKNNEYWKEQSGVNLIPLRLYTYQGAGIGFHLGYFFIFPLSLARAYLHLGSSILVEISAVALGLLLGNMGARVVPHNLWLAYGQLKLSDGWVFFAFFLLGPFWAFFLLNFYPILLTPFTGLLMILLAITGVVVMPVRQSKTR